MLNTLVLFVIGFYILIKGANLLVSGASSIARYFHMSQWAIGIVIVGVGTSIPELSINLASIFNGGDVGLGTIIGSNTFNILGILGLSAIVSPLVIKKEWVYRDFIFNILAVLIVTAMIYLPLLGPTSFMGITRSEGLLLFFLFIAWASYVGSRRDQDTRKVNYRVFAFSTSALMVLAGVVGVFFGGRWIVNGAELLAISFGVSDYLIGLTIVGIGTSLPEMAVSVTAAFKKNTGIAIGNIIGSNIFDFLGIIGTVAMFQPILISVTNSHQLEIDILFTLLATVALLVSTFVGTRNVLKRWEGLSFVSLYLAYLLFLFWR